MKKMLLILSVLILVIVFAGCGPVSRPPAKKPRLSMSIVVDQASVSGSSAIQFKTAAIPHDSSWFVDRPENGFLDTIGRGTDNNLSGGCTAYIVIKDELGNIIDPHEPNLITWTSSDIPGYLAHGFNALWNSSVQGKWHLHAVYQGTVLTNDDPVTYTPVDLSADAVLLLENRNSQPYPSWYTQYYNLTNHQMVATAGAAEIYKSVESGTIYVNAPYGAARILDQEIDQNTGLAFGRITGCIKSVPAGLTYSTKVALEQDYSTFIIRRADGGYTKATIWNSTSAFGLSIYYSNSPTTDFAISYWEGGQ